MEQGRGVHWERLTVLRSPLLLFVGLGFLCVAAFMWAPAAGWAAMGVSLILLGFLTDAPAAGQGGGQYGR